MPRKSQGILSRESPQTERFHTAWVKSRNVRSQQIRSALPSTGDLARPADIDLIGEKTEVLTASEFCSLFLQDQNPVPSTAGGCPPFGK